MVDECLRDIQGTVFDRDFMGSKPGQVELGVCSTSLEVNLQLSLTYTKGERTIESTYLGFEPLTPGL